MGRTFRSGLAVASLVLTSQALAMVTITLENGDRLRGELVAETPTELRLKHPMLGDVVVARDKVRTLEDGDTVSPPRPKPTIASVPDGGLLGSGWLTDWRRRMEVGVSGASGKSQNQRINVGFMADFEDTEERWNHRTRFYRRQSEGEVTSQSLSVALNRDGLVPGSPRFYFTGGQFVKDDFKDWGNRLTVNSGIGYQFVSTERWRLLGRGGVGAIQTWGGDDGSRFAPELLLGVDLNWRVTRQHSVALTNAYHPNIREHGVFRNITSVDWVIDLDKVLGAGLQIGVTNEYDSAREPGVGRNDFNYTSSLVWRL
jgi:hypothetical protein